MWFFSVVFLFIMNDDEGIAPESFSFKIIVRSPWYNHLSSNVSVIFLKTNCFEIQFVLTQPPHTFRNFMEMSGSAYQTTQSDTCVFGVFCHLTLSTK
jgi:hypothetical protein